MAPVFGLLWVSFQVDCRFQGGRDFKVPDKIEITNHLVRNCYYKELNEQMKYFCVRNKRLGEKIVSLADNIVEKLSKPKR